MRLRRPALYPEQRKTMEVHHNAEVGSTHDLSEVTTRQLHKLRKSMNFPVATGVITWLIREAHTRELDAEKTQEKKKSERPLVSLGQGEYRRDIMAGDV